jgi:type III secretion protein U
VVTNPTHLAVALRYEKDETPLPVVLGMGEGTVAHMMIAAAKEAGVPVVRNVPLARALYQDARVNEYIPSDLLEPVAKLLHAVRQMLATGRVDAAHEETGDTHGTDPD